MPRRSVLHRGDDQAVWGSLSRPRHDPTPVCVHISFNLDFWALLGGCAMVRCSLSPPLPPPASGHGSVGGVALSWRSGNVIIPDCRSFFARFLQGQL